MKEQKDGPPTRETKCVVAVALRRVKSFICDHERSYGYLKLWRQIMKQCAYCGIKNTLTKEHIWPKCLLNRTPSYRVRFSEKAKKIQEGEFLIKDVCSECNNNKLSELDSYICELYDQLFSKHVNFNEQIKFEYDYDLLARSLLKITYNTARASGQNVKELSDFAKYILGGSKRPTNFSMLLHLVNSALIIDQTNGETEELPPASVRSGRLESRGRDHPGIVKRVVAINSYYFYIFIFAPSVNVFDRNNFISQLAEKKSKFIQPSQKFILHTTGDEDTISIYEPHISMNQDIYDEYENRKKNN
jgi:hypothetical protein